MEKTTGVLTKVSYKADKNSYGVEIGQGNWYNGFGEPGCKKGDKVEIEFEVNGQWKNVSSLKVLEASSEPDQKTSYGRDPEVIVKTDCYKMAVDLHIADPTKDIESTAEELYKKIMNK
ncbi:MAG: hypothetical protein IIA87_03275 [Nanoarchaeota archaeon]|nr:hypothetical protein [Nanoarchaeota archaeon]